MPVPPVHQESLRRWSSVTKALTVLQDPVGSLAVDDALSSLLPLACHGARTLLTAAVRLLRRAEQDLQVYEQRYKERMDAISGGAKKRRRAALVEQEEQLSSAEREYMQGRGHLGAIEGEARMVETRRRLKLELLERRVKARDDGLPQGRYALSTSRSLLERYVWTQLHSQPAASSHTPLADEPLHTWGRISVPLSTVVTSYRRTIRVLRERRESLLLAQSLRELGLLYISRGGDAARDEAMKVFADAVDAAVGQLDAVETWTKLATVDLFETVGVVRSVLAAVVLADMVRHSPLNLSLRLKCARLAALLLAVPFKSSVSHPQSAAGFATYTPSALVPGVDVFADARALPVSAVLSAARLVASTLLQYGSEFADAVLPVVALYEHVAGDVAGLVRRVVDARVLRMHALVATGNYSAAADVLASIVRCARLPHSGGGSGARPGSAAPADAAGTPSEGSWKLLPQLATYHNHLPPTHPLNRAALCWIAHPYANAFDTKQVVGLQAALVAAIGPIVASRVALVRAELLVRIVSSPFTTAPPLTELHWGDGEWVAGADAGSGRAADAAASEPSMTFVRALARRHPHGPDRVAAVLSEAKLCEGGAGVTEQTMAWGGATVPELCATVLAAATQLVSMVQHQQSPSSFPAVEVEPPVLPVVGAAAAAAGAKGAKGGAAKPAAAAKATPAKAPPGKGGKGAPVVEAPPPVDPATLAPPTRAQTHVLAVACCVLASVAVAKALPRLAASHTVESMRLLAGLPVSASDASTAVPPASLSGSDLALGGGKEAEDDAAAASEAEAVLECRKELGVDLALPHWLRCRATLAKLLLSCGPGDAAAMLDVALREAREASESLLGHRLLCARAEVAVFCGDGATARAALDVVCRAGDTVSAAPALCMRAVLRSSLDDSLASLLTAQLTARSHSESKADTDVAAARTTRVEVLCDSIRDLERAESLVRQLLVSQGWDGRYVDDVEDVAVPRPMQDTLYHPHVPLLASVRSRLASAWVLRAVLRGGGAGPQALQAAERKWMQARNTLRHVVFPNPVLVARVLEGVGRTRRLVRACWCSWFWSWLCDCGCGCGGSCG